MMPVTEEGSTQFQESWREQLWSRLRSQYSTAANGCGVRLLASHIASLHNLTSHITLIIYFKESAGRPDVIANLGLHSPWHLVQSHC